MLCILLVHTQTTLAVRTTIPTGSVVWHAFKVFQLCPHMPHEGAHTATPQSSVMNQHTMIFSPGTLGRFRAGGLTVMTSNGFSASGNSCWISERQADFAPVSSDLSFLMQTLWTFFPSSPLPARLAWNDNGREWSSVASMSRELVKSSLHGGGGGCFDSHIQTQMRK